MRAIVPDDGAYVSESNFFQENWQQAYWGSNYARLASVKMKYDPTGLFFVHNGVGSEDWSEDGFMRRTEWRRGETDRSDLLQDEHAKTTRKDSM